MLDLAVSSVIWPLQRFLIHTEKELLESLPLNRQCTEEEQELLHFLFENKLKKVSPKNLDNWLKVLTLGIKFSWIPFILNIEMNMDFVIFKNFWCSTSHFMHYCNSFLLWWQLEIMIYVFENLFIEKLLNK